MKILMHLFCTSRCRVALLCLLCLAPLGDLVAQPTLTLKRVTNNWPTIELYFNVSCGGAPYLNLTKENIRVTENGEDVGTFTLWCPPARYHCSSSLAFVLDASGSMSGAAAQEAVNVAGRLVDHMDGSIDEALMVFSAGTPQPVLPMTTERARLHAALASYSPFSASALFDGIYAGLEELISNGVNQCRAVIVLSDGEDNSSTHTIQEITTLANRHRIRVITIGVGDIVGEDELASIAQLTGGIFSRNPDSLEVQRIYDRAATGIVDWPTTECLITYEPGCGNGTLRTVDLQVRDVCGGSDGKIGQYQAPLDSSSLGSFDIILQSARVASNGPSTIAIDIDPRGDTIVLPPFELELRLDASLQFGTITAPAGSALYGVPLQIDTNPGNVVVRISQPVTISGAGRLFEVEVSLLTAPTTAESLLDIVEMRVSSGCYLPRIRNNPVHVLPRISISQALCEGGSAVLEGTPGFSRYIWSTGDTTRVITVVTAGFYGLRAVTEQGDTLTADPVDLILRPTATVRIAHGSTLNLCPGSGVVDLNLSGAADDMSIRWSNGQMGRSIYIRTPGSYWAVATSPYGCVSYTDTVIVTANAASLSIAASGSLTLCPGDSVVLSLPGDFQSIRWQEAVRSSTFTVAWTKPDPLAERTITVSAYDVFGCRGTDSIVVHMLDPLMPEISPGPLVELCQGAAATLHAGSGLVNYRWSTGDTTEAIEVRQPGMYTVTVDDPSGCRVADTVFVTLVQALQPAITMNRAGLLCGSEGVRLDAGPGWASYRWSNGALTQYIDADSAGSYWVEVTGHGGCAGRSDTVHIIREVEPRDFLPTARGSQPLCPGDTLWLDGPGGMTLWQWNTGHRNPSLPVTKAGRYAVTVVTPGGCEVRSGFIDVSMTPSVPPVITRSTDVLSSSAARSYLWYFNGQPIVDATQQTLTVVEKGSYTVVVVDEYGCTMTSEPFIVNILGISGAEVPDDLLLYPEPASDWLQIAFPEHSRNARVALLSLLGQVLMRHETSGDSAARSMRIDLTALPAGIYLLHASAGEKWWVRKVVVRR